MRAPALGAALVLAFLWATAPWPEVRWAASTGLLFVLISGLWSAVVARGLRVGSGPEVTRTFSGRRLTLETSLENRSPLPTGLLFVADSSGGLETWGDTRRWAGLGAFRRRRFEYAVRGRERGRRTLGPLQVTGSDPAGLFPFRLSAPARTLLVYPPVRPVRGQRPQGLPPGPRRWEPVLVEDPGRLKTHRPFEAGDPISRISAAAWARTGVPQVTVFERSVGLPTLVVADLRGGRYPLKLRWALVEAAIETAASLVWHLLGRGETVWLTVLDASDSPRTVGPGQGWAAARVFLERLAEAAPDPGRGDAGPVVLPQGPRRGWWIGPPDDEGLPPIRGLGWTRIPMEEGRTHGPVDHP